MKSNYVAGPGSSVMKTPLRTPNIRYWLFIFLICVYKILIKFLKNLHIKNYHKYFVFIWLSLSCIPFILYLIYLDWDKCFNSF